MKGAGKNLQYNKEHKLPFIYLIKNLSLLKTKSISVEFANLTTVMRQVSFTFPLFYFIVIPLDRQNDKKYRSTCQIKLLSLRRTSLLRRILTLKYSRLGGTRPGGRRMLTNSEWLLDEEFRFDRCTRAEISRETL